MAEAPSTELVAHDEAGLDRLSRSPIIDSVDARTLALIKAQVAKNCTDAEVGYFLELAAHYDLDPFAREIWCAKDDKPNARVLIMVGRDGLRKIAQREGFRIDGDVVHEKDTFSVKRDESGRRTVVHQYDGFADRGPIVGAWCEVRRAPTRTALGQAIPGESVGFFVASLAEYKPQNVSQYSPWSKQTSVMILAAAERQALRQATPLSGLLAEGEDESANAIGTGTGNGEPPGWGDMREDAVQAVERVVERAKALGHGGLSDLATAQMSLVGQPESVIAMWVSRARVELDAFEAGRQSDVDEARDREAAAGVAEQMAAPQNEQDDDPVAARAALDALLDRISAEEEAGADEAVLAPLFEEQERLEAIIGRDEPGEGQETMPL